MCWVQWMALEGTTYQHLLVVGLLPVPCFYQIENFSPAHVEGHRLASAHATTVTVIPIEKVDCPNIINDLSLHIYYNTLGRIGLPTISGILSRLLKMNIWITGTSKLALDFWSVIPASCHKSAWLAHVSLLSNQARQSCRVMGVAPGLKPKLFFRCL